MDDFQFPMDNINDQRCVTPDQPIIMYEPPPIVRNGHHHHTRRVDGPVKRRLFMDNRTWHRATLYECPHCQASFRSPIHFTRHASDQHSLYEVEPTVLSIMVMEDHPN